MEAGGAAPHALALVAMVAFQPAEAAAAGERYSQLLGEDQSWTIKGTAYKATLSKINTDANGKITGVVLNGMGKDGTTREKTFALSDLAEGDQELIRGLAAMPNNIELDLSNAKDAAEEAKWREQVIKDFGRLNELPGGKKLLDDIKAANSTEPITIKVGRGGNQFTWDKGRFGPTNLTIEYNPNRVQGDTVVNGSRERPPFMGLAKELFSAGRALTNQLAKGGANLGNINVAEDLAGAKFTQQLRNEWNRLSAAQRARLWRDQMLPQLKAALME